MRKVIFKVKIPIPNTNNFKEIEFESRKSICEFLKITNNTLYSLTTQRLKLKHKNKKHLEGIIIEKTYVEGVKKNIKTDEEVEIDKFNFQQQLLEQIKSLEK